MSMIRPSKGGGIGHGQTGGRADDQVWEAEDIPEVLMKCRC